MSSTFRAQDLQSSTVDTRWKKEKWTWTPGSLRHVIKALAGQQVAIELDNMTGWTLVGATLTSAYGDRLDVVTEAAKNPGNPTGVVQYFIPKVGVIVGLGDCSRYGAIESERREHELARQLFDAEFPDRREGKTDIRSTADGVSVSYRPTTYRSASCQSRTYSLAQIQQASPCDTCVTLTLDYDNLHEQTCPVYLAHHAERTAARA
jgi:hypothetical protein